MPSLHAGAGTGGGGVSPLPLPPQATVARANPIGQSRIVRDINSFGPVAR